MSNYFRILIFVALILWSFYYMSSSIPQQPSLPPVKEKLDPAQIKTKADLVNVGRKIFFGKGQCALCHTIGPSHGARAPNLEGVGAKLSRAFIYESTTQPSKYIYMDYTASPPKPFPAHMPIINKPPVDLDGAELLAVIAFVQSLGGEVTVEPSELAAFLPPPVVKGDPEAGRQVFTKLECARCHKELSPILGKYASKESLRAAVVRPAGVASQTEGKEGKPPHFEFDRKLTVKDLDNLMAYLEELQPAQKPAGAPAPATAEAGA